MRLAHALLLALSVAPAAVPAADDIRFPALPVAPQPMPVPTPPPGSVDRLTADTLYVVESDVPTILLVSPPGIVAVTEDAGPLRMRGKFAGGSGKVETRQFTGKQVFTLEAVGSGRVEVIVVPVGAKSPTDVVRKVLDVGEGKGPQPPPVPPDPKPDPKPDPDPKPKPGPVSGPVWVIVVEQNADRTPETAKVLNDTAGWVEIGKLPGVAGWRFYDLDSPDTKRLRYDLLAAEQKKGYPVVLVLDERGKLLRSEKLPADTAGVRDIVREATGK